MRVIRSTYSSLIAVLSLISIASSGVLLPILHEVEHAAEVTCSNERHGHCDHNDHDVAFEKAQVVHGSQLCVLCSRDVVDDANLSEASFREVALGSDHDSTPEFVAVRPGPKSYSARAPPAE